MNERQNHIPKPVGRTQQMLEQAMDLTMTGDNVVVVARDRTHQRELVARLRQMGAKSRDDDTLTSSGKTIYVVTPSKITPDYDGGWKMDGTRAVVLIDHAAEVML